MSYRSRQRKRAIRATQQSTREVQAPRWYRTIVSRDCSCNRCGRALRKGVELVYRHTPRTVLCVACAERERLDARPSLRWEKRRAREIRGRHAA